MSNSNWIYISAYAYIVREFDVLSLLASVAILVCPAQAETLRSAATEIEAAYFDADAGRRMAASVREWATQDRYAADCTDRAAFIRRFNQDLDAFDGHFIFEPETSEPASETDWLVAWRNGSREANAGVREVRILEGNVGYIRLSSFYPWDLAQPKLSHALSLVSDAGAIILDLRQNGGGDDETANQLISAALASDSAAPAPQQWIDTRAGRRADVLPMPALSPFGDTPLIVLVDRRSGSASEAVAYTLQATGRARIVGSRSGGAAHLLGEPRSVRGGYRLGVPEARPVNRITGENWEGKGVEPDVSGGDDPLHVARVLLLTTLTAD